MAETWPSDLPQQLLLNGASLAEGDGLVEYDPDIGPSITRRGTTAVMRPLVGTMICSSAQISSFRTFFNTTIMGGALAFTFPDPLGGAALLVKFSKKGGMPQIVPLGADNYQLSLSVMVLP